jgi:hypothetical protein
MHALEYSNISEIVRDFHDLYDLLHGVFVRNIK